MGEMIGEYKYRNDWEGEGGGGKDWGDKKVFVVFFLVFAQILDSTIEPQNTPLTYEELIDE